MTTPRKPRGPGGPKPPRKGGLQGGPPRPAGPRRWKSLSKAAKLARAGDALPESPAKRSAAPKGEAGKGASTKGAPAKGAPRGKQRGASDAGLSKSGSTVKARDEGPMRVQRALARAGAVSRREADKAVAEGRVLVNGSVADVGQVVDPARDTITLDGKVISTHVTAHTWIVLHKPSAVMTTRRDPKGRPTVFDLVNDVPGLVYVGRLDFMTEGVLLLTTDGTAAHALTHPSREVERTYVATVQGDVQVAVRQARKGVELEDGLVTPREVSAQPLGDRRWAFEITIAEGRNHEVRRICETLGLEVERLVRTRFGPVRLGELPAGGARAISPTERDLLDAIIANG